MKDKMDISTVGKLIAAVLIGLMTGGYLSGSKVETYLPADVGNKLTSKLENIERSMNETNVKLAHIDGKIELITSQMVEHKSKIDTMNADLRALEKRIPYTVTFR